MSNCWSGETSFNRKLGKFIEVVETWAGTHCHLTPPPNTCAKCPAGEKPLGFPCSGELGAGSGHLKLESLSHKNTERIQTRRCRAQFGCYCKTLERACDPGAWAACRGPALRGRSGRPPEVPALSVLASGFYLLKSRSLGFMDIWNISL